MHVLVCVNGTMLIRAQHLLSKTLITRKEKKIHLFYLNRILHAKIKRSGKDKTKNSSGTVNRVCILQKNISANMYIYIYINFCFVSDKLLFSFFVTIFLFLFTKLSFTWNFTQPVHVCKFGLKLRLMSTETFFPVILS